jgi:hypothetical protein
MLKFGSFGVAAVVATSLTALVATSVDAQNRRNRDRDQAAEAPAAATPQVSRAFGAAYGPIQTAMSASDWAAADAALPAARAAAQSEYERYLVSRADFAIGAGQANPARQLAAANAMIESNGIPATEQARVYLAAGQLAYNSEQYAMAAERVQRAIELGSTAPNLSTLVIDAHFRAGQLDQGLAVFRSVVAAATAAGQKAPESIYSLAARELQEADRTTELMAVLIERANAYPTEANMRSSALIYLQSLPPAATRPEEVYQRGLSIDALRLMRAANAMNDRRFYVELVSNLAEDALPNEVLTVIAEGEAASLVPPTGDAFFTERKQTARDNLAEDRASLAGAERRAVADPAARLVVRVADAYFAYENWAKAEELYTAALSKTEADTGLINLRIGQTRYRAGNFAGAMEAFAQVREGDRAPLARLWEAHVRTKLTPAAAAEPAAAPAT